MLKCYDLKKTVVSLPSIGTTYLMTYVEGYGVLTYHDRYREQYDMKRKVFVMLSHEVFSYFISLENSLMFDVQDYVDVDLINGRIGITAPRASRANLDVLEFPHGVDDFGHVYHGTEVVRHELHPVTIQFIVQLISRRVSGDDLVKGLRSHGFSRPVKLIQDVLGGWIVKLDGNRATIFDVIAELEHCVTTAE